LAADPRASAQAATVRVTLRARRGEWRAAQEGIERAIAARGIHDDVFLTPRTASFLALVSGTAVPKLDSAAVRASTTKSVVTRGWHAALAGDLPAARHALSALSRRSPDELARSGAAREFLEASIAAAEQRWSDVIRLIGPTALRGDDGGFATWGRIGPAPERWLVADAWEQLGAVDSAAAAFERVVATRHIGGIVFYVPYAHQRLVMLYARMGRREDAERHWREFSAAFTHPDPELKHLLDDSRAAIMSLRGMQREEAQRR
jgi:hypothetical protein